MNYDGPTWEQDLIIDCLLIIDIEIRDNYFSAFWTFHVALYAVLLISRML